jgi:hypothetical protein
VVAFTIYVVLVTFFAARWRRTVRAFAVVAAAEGVLIALAWAHLQIPELESRGYRLASDINIRPFQAILYPYIVLTGFMGFFVASLPRRAPVESCAHCRYDLTSLLDEPLPLVCPECGRQHVRVGSREYRRSGVTRFNHRESDVVSTIGEGLASDE